MKYKVIRPYAGRSFLFAVVLPIGTILTYWEERGFYLSEAVDGICVPVARWAVESWSNYFEKVTE